MSIAYPNGETAPNDGDMSHMASQPQEPFEPHEGSLPLLQNGDDAEMSDDEINAAEALKNLLIEATRKEDEENYYISVLQVKVSLSEQAHRDALQQVARLREQIVRLRKENKRLTEFSAKLCVRNLRN